jgi:peptidoglycan/LPS O-acetylase OafA/YrhL
VATQLLHTALVVVVSLAGAEILYRTVERPMIAVGRRLSATRRPERSLS